MINKALDSQKETFTCGRPAEFWPVTALTSQLVHLHVGPSPNDRLVFYLISSWVNEIHSFFCLRTSPLHRELRSLPSSSVDDRPPSQMTGYAGRPWPPPTSVSFSIPWWRWLPPPQTSAEKKQHYMQPCMGFFYSIVLILIYFLLLYIIK